MTRAIRNAMAVSVAVLALSVPNAVLAAGASRLDHSCSHDAHSTTRLCSADLLRIQALDAAPVDLTQVADGQAPTSVYAADASFGPGGVRELSPTTASAPTFVDLVDDPAWIDAGFAGDAGLPAHDFSSAGDIAIASAAPVALAVPPNYSDILVTGNPAVGLDLVDDATALSNYASIGANAPGGTYSAYATGVRANAGLYDADIASVGTITADAYSSGFLSYATGVFNHASEGDAHLTNTGDIHAHASGDMWAFAFGVYNIASVYNDESTVDNAGLIHASANAANGADFQRAWAAGVRVSSGYAYSGYYGPSEPAGNDYVHLVNDGTIAAEASIDGSGGNAVAWGGLVQSLNDYGIAQLDNSGTMTAYTHATSVGGAYATFADSIGAYSAADGRLAAISNFGDVSATAVVDGFGYARSIAMKARYISSSNDLATIDNQGTATAHAQAGSGYVAAIAASTGELDGSQYSLIHNAYGAGLYASANNDGYGIAKATGISGRSLEGAYVVNEGTVVADANLIHSVGSYGQSYSVALGILATANQSGEARIANIGDVEASAVAGGTYANSTADATGLRATGYDVAAIDNAGYVHAYATGQGDAYAYGAVTSAQHWSYLNNTADGTIVAVSDAGGYSVAVGAFASGRDSTTLTNYGDISATSNSDYGHAQAYAAIVYGSYIGIGLLINGGDLTADASAGDGGFAQATGAYVMGNVASVFNDASSNATATAGAGGMAEARGAGAYGMYSAVSNYGDLGAIAVAGDNGIASAKGVDSFGYYGSQAHNGGTIVADATAANGTADAIGSYSIGAIFSSYTTNAGSISATATGDQSSAMGVLNAATYIGNAVTVNEGDVSAIAVGGLADYGEAEAIVFGLYNFAQYYDSVVDNRGSILVSAAATTDIDPTEGFLQAKAIGAIARNGYGIGATMVANTGDIRASAVASTGYAVAWGAVAQSPGVYEGVAQIENDGSVWSYAHVDIGMATTTGAYAVNAFGTSEIVNHGDVVSTAKAERGISGVALDFAVAYGARTRSYYGDVAIANYGHIESNASVVGGIGYSYGVMAGGGGYADVHNAADASILATVRAELFGGAFVNAVTAAGIYGVNVANEGSVTAYAFASGYTDYIGGHYGASGATGIYAAGSFMGDASVTNSGVVNAIAIAQDAPGMLEGGAAAVGIDGYGDGVVLANYGDVNAIAQAEFGIASTSGINAHGKYSNDIVNAAGASIYSFASAGRINGDPEPARAFAWGTQNWASDYATTYNAGSIVAQALTVPDANGATGDIAAAYGSIVGRNSGVVVSELVNLGDIAATAQADFGYATAYGTYVHGLDEASIYNAGEVRASAISVAGNAFAVGNHAYSLNLSITYNCDDYGCDWANPIIAVEGGEARIDNVGDILATANAVGGVGYTYGATTFAAYTSAVANAGHITAVTQADDAIATGALVSSFYGDASLANDGDIVASATGILHADAIGALVGGANGAQVDNTGRILAGAYGTDASATAVAMGDTGSNVLTNTGTIAALGDGERIAVLSGAGATANIANTGSIVGAIVTGDLDDSFDNAAGATWLAIGESDFGGGTDDIVNHGTVVMDDSTIRLSGGVSALPVAPGIGTFSHLGVDAFENFGTIAVSGSANLIEGNLYNNGVIGFVDGAADDVLTVTGDFAGEGALNIDVSGLNAVADQVYVEGAVLDPSQTININLLDLPSAPDFEIPLITSTGALTGTFALGNVHYVPMGFVSMDFNLNRTSHMVALGMEVSGLSGTGSVASSLAPGVQSLMSAQVGTWRQRVGLVPELGASGDAGVSPWLRVFSESGDVDPRHSANFGTGGDFGFHQSNHGWEVGLDARPTQHLAIGALVSKSASTQSVHDAGSDRLDAQSFGLYATWVADSGFYLDLSQRWASVGARLRTAEGSFAAEASASAFNVEAGMKLWSLRGIDVMPQLQYTRTRVEDIDTLHDAGADFVNEGGVSSRARVGVAFDASFQGKRFTWTPYGSLNAVREFDGEYDHAINGALLGTTRTDGTSGMVEMGLGMHRDPLSLTGSVNWTDGGALDSVKGAQLTLRYDW